MDTLAVGAAAVPSLLRAGVAGGLALARHGTGGLARGVGGRAGLDGIVGADVCRRLVNVHFGLKMGAGGSFLPIFYQKHQFLALSKARKDPTWWFCGVFQLVNEAPKRFYGVFQLVFASLVPDCGVFQRVNKNNRAIAESSSLFLSRR